MKIWSKKRKILFWLAVFLICVTVLYLIEGSSVSAEMALRRMEKRHLIGPAKIIDTPDFSDPDMHILIGKSDYGYTFFEWYGRREWDNGKLTYVPKKEGATLYCTEDMYPSEQYSAEWTPIFAFVDHEGAVSAKLTLEITYDGKTVSYPLEAEKSPEGYFLFSWETLFLPGEEYWSIQQLIAGQYTEKILDGYTAQATLELYDKNGKLLETHLFTK